MASSGVMTDQKLFMRAACHLYVGRYVALSGAHACPQLMAAKPEHRAGLVRFLRPGQERVPLDLLSIPTVPRMVLHCAACDADFELRDVSFEDFARAVYPELAD